MIIASGASVNAATEFNYYFPVKIKEKFTYAFLGLISSYESFLKLSKVFKLYGTSEIIYSDLYKNSNFGTNTFLVDACPWTHADDTATTTLTSKADWEVASGVVNGYGTVNTHSTSSFTKSTTGMAFYTASNIYPDSNVSYAIIDASSSGLG